MARFLVNYVKVESFDGGDISLRAWRMGQALLKTASKPPENGYQCPRTQSYCSNIENSVVIFNQQLDTNAAAAADQKHDWPWCYAKTCAQVSDWLRHEIGIHLTDTHLVEEAVIVATHRTIPCNIQYSACYRHIGPTLSLNASAHDTLVPDYHSHFRCFCQSEVRAPIVRKE